jgi:4-amino-4-deoxy-L-arabinose transferase-like glycosyltransferase
MRVLLFALLSAGVAWALLKIPSPTSSPDAPDTLLSHTLPYGLIAALIFAGLLVLPNLDVYPRAAPDEMHHLIVARNLAIHGIYASGHPDTGLTQFDVYDSVGAPVIVPIAAAFRLTGVSLQAARVIMALYFLALCIVLYMLVAPVLGRNAALLGVVLGTAAYSSIYLGRTLYGEVPALFYLVLGLLCWRCSLRQTTGRAMALLAGISFGMAILCKTIFILTAFPVLGALLFDRLGPRRIRLPHVVLPVLGMVLTIGSWWLYQTLAQSDVSDSAQSTIALYQQYFLFGISSVPKALRTMAPGPQYVLGNTVALLALLFVIPTLFSRRYDPPCMVLFLLAIFFAYWWLFFTPGRITRYLWPLYLTAAVCTGALICDLTTTFINAQRNKALRIGACAALLVVLAPAGLWVQGQAREVYGNREMEDDYAIADFVKTMPSGTSITTTYPPMRDTLNFLGHFSVTVGDEPVELLGRSHVLIQLENGEIPTPEAPAHLSKLIGPYRLFYPKMAQPLSGTPKKGTIE